jgi:hypothetical protein
MITMETLTKAGTNASISDWQKEFAKLLNEKIGESFSRQLDGKFNTMNVPKGFYWGIQFGPNNYYNEKSLQQMNLQPITGSNDILTVGGNDFITMYNGILNNIVYAFSEADQEQMAKGESNASSQIQAVINSWENGTGASISTEDIKEADCFPATKLGYIDYQVQKRWDGDINKIPSSLNSLKVAYQTYQVAAQDVFRLQSASAAAILRLQAARANSLNPSATNGGLQTAASSFNAPFGPFPIQNKINGDLQTLSNTAEIEMSLSNFSSETTSVQVSVSGGVGILIPVLNFLSIDFGGSSSYSLDTFTSSSSTIKINIIYEGVTFVGAPLTAANLTTNNKEGWYDNQIIQQAIANTDKSKTGYSLIGSTYPVDKYFGEGKIFSRVKTWVISQQPKITMKFHNANTEVIKSHFKVNASASVNLFGIFEVGSVSQSYEVAKVDSSTSSEDVTVEMGPSKIIGTTPANDATAYVVGGVPSYPPEEI